MADDMKGCRNVRILGACNNRLCSKKSGCLYVFRKGSPKDVLIQIYEKCIFKLNHKQLMMESALNLNLEIFRFDNS